ncbi:hypothetical protein KFU94_31795, partial [Chloroflexi bacterium TSY]|nr:hypothetical protein [Chloroflexi bacterium TSY]
YQGRFITVLFCILTALLSAVIVRRRLLQLVATTKNRDAGSTNISTETPDRGAITCLLIFFTSLYAIAYYSFTATYALAAFFMTSSLFVLTYVGPTKMMPAEGRLDEAIRAEVVRNVAVTVLVSLAMATRLSILAAIPPLAFYLILTSRQRLKAALWICGALIISWLIFFGPFWLLSEGRMEYDIFGFHTDRILSMKRQFYKMLRVLRESAVFYMVPLLLFLTGSLYRSIYNHSRSVRFGPVRQVSERADDSLRQSDQNNLTAQELTHSPEIPYQQNGFELLLVAMTLALLVLHFIPRTTASYYNALQLPLISILGAIGLAHIAQYVPRYRSKKGFVCLLGSVTILHFLINTGVLFYFELVRFPPENQIATVQEAASFLRTIDQPDGQLLTLNTHLALEAGMNVPHGYEMSIFSYRPDWDAERALAHNAVNNERLIQDLEQGADAVALTDFDLERFYGERQRIFDTLNQHYRRVKTQPGFDPFYNDLHIFLPPQFSPSEPSVNMEIAFEWGIKLLGYDLDPVSLQPGDRVYLGLYWQAPTLPLTTDYTVFVHVLDASGNMATSWDNPPCHSTCPTRSWRPNEMIRDEYIITLPNELAAGEYTVRIGMYDSRTVELLPILSESENVVENRLQLTKFQVRK